MKSHQSHDVLLLCPSCHEISNCHDLRLRRRLADICDAPLSNSLPNFREQVPKGLRMLQTAVTILQDGSNLPPEKKKELEYYVLKFTGHEKVTSALLDTLNEQFSKKSFKKNNFRKEETKKSAKPHGLKVCLFIINVENGKDYFFIFNKCVKLNRLWSILKKMKEDLLN